MRILQLLVTIELLSVVGAFLATNRVSQNSIQSQPNPSFHGSSSVNLSSDQSNEEAGSKAKVRFTGVQGTNAVDQVLSLFISDVGSIAIGLIGLLLLLVARSADGDTSSVDNLAQETRTTLLAVIATGSVLLNGISKLDVDSVMSEAVTLDGMELATMTTEEAFADAGWGLEALLAATPAKSALTLKFTSLGGWKVTAASGILPSSSLDSLEIPSSTPILDRFKSPQQKETYLPTLQALPGRFEFTYLPSNTQATLLLPVDGESVVVLVSNQAKSFTPRNIAWAQSIASRLGSS